MNIIIVGCGKVGYTLVEQLGGENHNITVIDTNEEKVNSITDDLDAMGIVGNGVSFQTLSEAGIDHADLLIAVTGSDEQNLLCCVIAKKAGLFYEIFECFPWFSPSSAIKKFSISLRILRVLEWYPAKSLLPVSRMQSPSFSLS